MHTPLKRLFVKSLTGSSRSSTPRSSNGLRRKATTVASLGTLLMAGVPYASTQSTNSNKVDVALSATIAQSLTITVAVPTVAFGVVTPGTTNAAPAGQAVAVVSSWNLTAGQTVNLYAYFSTAAAAMTGTAVGDQIPTSAITGAVNGGAQQTFSQTSPFTTAATAMSLYSIPITSTNAITLARSDSLALTLGLSGLSLHTDIYLGTMHLQAQAL